MQAAKELNIGHDTIKKYMEKDIPYKCYFFKSERF
jgi:hypothetical protein